jgi:dipeptidyl aminopeptidase/acylaminoacyl peptidase
VTGLPADLIAQASVSYDAAGICPAGVFWIEGRPDGRDVLVRWTAEHGRRDVTPSGFSVASYVHGYGGVAWTTDGDSVWFCNAEDQRIYRTAARGVTPITPAPPQPGAIRYADLRVEPGGRWLWAVRERHDSDRVINDLVRVSVAADNPGEAVRTVASGWDFYSFPRPSPDGRWLAWTCWNAPQMPWDGTSLYTAAIGPDGELGEGVLVAGGRDESVFQPEWSPGGVLHFVSDRDGWWGLYSWEQGRVYPVLIGAVELGVAQWEFGYSTYAFLGYGRIAVISQKEARQSIKILDQQRARVRTVQLPYTSIKPYLPANGNQVALIASSPVQTPSVVVVDVDSGNTQTIAAAEPLTDTESLSRPRSFSFTTRDGAEVHGLFYPPWGGAADGPPPLVVKAHPGPTANIQMRLDWHTQYLASHGFAVAEIDYRGSTGHGRAFRNALRGRWGERDALDCADAAEHLFSVGQADPQRTAIWGASAGGYTALRAQILTQTFAAAVARSPVIDPRTWRDAAPKFQAHHADALIGPWPQAADTYRARSVLEHADAIKRPVLLLHGEQDPITPVAESRALADALGGRARLTVFPGEGHTLRSPDAQRRALELELDFLITVVDDRRASPGC